MKHGFSSNAFQQLATKSMPQYYPWEK